MASKIILAANPGSSSRKYAIYKGEELCGELHFEIQNGKIICNRSVGAKKDSVEENFSDINQSFSRVFGHFNEIGAFTSGEKISAIGLRIVAPGSYFLENHLVDDEFMENLEEARALAPLHVSASLEELKEIKQRFPLIPTVGVSDSAFHSSKPDYAKYYAIPLADSKRFDIARFGYHGLSVQSVVRQLQNAEKLPPKIVVAHLGSGSSVTAVLNAKSIDSTMGYSPLEGLVMSTRSGSIDATALDVIRESLGFEDPDLEDYLNTKSGLLGLGGSSEIPQLLEKETGGDENARLALNAYVYGVQKGIAQMAVALGGIDALVFTGTVGERSSPIRHHVLNRLQYMDFHLDEDINQRQTDQASEPTIISKLAHSKPIFVIHTNENLEIATLTSTLLNQ